MNAQAFWTKVDRSGDCWLWTGNRNEGGYGRVAGGYRNAPLQRAHRVAWQLTNGPIPEGFDVCHRCDNPPCVNPAHLFLGTRKDNMQDMAAKLRGNRGERNNFSRLRADQVVEIRRLVAEGHAKRKVARQFGVAGKAVQAIATGAVWRSAGGPISAPKANGMSLDAAAQILARCKAGEKRTVIAATSGVSLRTVNNIAAKRGRYSSL